jgi:hypothetical protein
MRFSTLPFSLVLACALCALAAHAEPGQAAEPGRADYSPAERLLFMTPHLKTVQPPTVLRYTFSKTGRLEQAFTDEVTVTLTAKTDGSCCDAKAAFLTGAHTQPAPDVPDAAANPVILYFLEHDVREMKRLTGGSEYHFRQRLRMAIYQKAEVRDVTLGYQGREVKGKEIAFSPFLDDPNRPKYEKFAKKSYRLLLSTAVPGGVYGIRTRLPGDDATIGPLLAEDLAIAGARMPADPADQRNQRDQRDRQTP